MWKTAICLNLEDKRLREYQMVNHKDVNLKTIVRIYQSIYLTANIAKFVIPFNTSLM